MLTVTLQKHQHMLKRFLDESGENSRKLSLWLWGGSEEKKLANFWIRLITFIEKML